MISATFHFWCKSGIMYHYKATIKEKALSIANIYISSSPAPADRASPFTQSMHSIIIRHLVVFYSAGLVILYRVSL